MEPKETGRNSVARWLWPDFVAAAFLFLATAAVVVWQNSRLGVLWDLSYILENSYRISLGDIPYRDFPFPYAPLTFLTQAVLIKLTGRVFWHHIVYCATVGGLGTVLTWRILLHQLSGVVTQARVVALMLSAPLIVLGIYCVYPHPFYDPDCTFVILLCIFLLQRLERKGFSALPTFLTGVLLVVPVFVKQNTGLAFIGSVGLAIGMLVVVETWWRTKSTQDACTPRGYVLLICGAVAGLTFALLLIHLFAGLGNYRHWTITFAAARRAPSFADMLSVYEDRTLLFYLAAFLIGALALWLIPGRSRGWQRTFVLPAVLLLSVPFAWPVIYLFVEKDPSERAERLLSLWPFLLIVAFAVCTLAALLNIRRRSKITLLLPLVLIGTIHGAFLSQQLWGSTYALWPLLMLLVAGTITAAAAVLKERFALPIIPMASVIALTLLVSGGVYVRSHERLDYVDLDGEMVRSTLPALRGLSLRGSWLPDFEELVRYSEKEIPREDGILMLPGEDLFYYTTGRHPRFPVLMFDHTVNPYSAEEIFEQARTRNIRWLVVKENIQLDEEPFAEQEQLLKLLRQDFKQIESLNNYEIFRRKTPGDTEDEPDDDDQSDDESDNPPEP